MTPTHFTIAYWCVLAAALLPLFCAGLAKYASVGKSRRDGGFDNHNPRAWLAAQTGWKARAHAAQQNTFEALPFFFAAVIIAHLMQSNQARLDILAMTFIFLRVAFVIMYVADLAAARSVIWVLALLVNVAILVGAYR